LFFSYRYLIPVTGACTGRPNDYFRHFFIGEPVADELDDWHELNKKMVDILTELRGAFIL